MAIVVVQSKSVSNLAASNNTTLAFTSNVTSGNAIIAIALGGNNSISVSDSLTDSYTQVFTASVKQINVFIGYAGSTGANTVTLNDNFTSSRSLHIYEVSGLASSLAFDKSASGAVTQGATITSPSTAVTSFANELVVVGVYDNSTNAPVYTVGTGFGNFQSPTGSSGNQWATETKVISATGAQNGTFTQTPTGNATAEMFTVTFSDTPNVLLPTVTTQAVTAITGTTATGNGNITVTGGANSTTRGVVYDTITHALPGNVAPGSSGYASSVIESGSFGTGAFTESITGLSLGTKYFVRAFSQNSTGYSYGAEVTFQTPHNTSFIVNHLRPHLFSPGLAR